MVTVLICSVLLVEAEAVSLYWRSPWPDRAKVLIANRQSLGVSTLAAMLSREATAVCRMDLARELASRPSAMKDRLVIQLAQVGDRGHARVYDFALALQWPSGPGRRWLRHVVTSEWATLDRDTRARVAFSLMTSGRSDDERLIRSKLKWSSEPFLDSAKSFALRRPLPD